MKLSIEKLKELLPDGEVDRRSKYMLASCPSCGHKEFTISLEDGHKCGCNRKRKCGFISNIYGLAKLLGKLSLLNIEGEVGKIEKLENKLLKKEEILNLELPKISMPVGWQRVYQDDYLDSRGFTEYDRYKVGRTLIDPRLKRNYIITAVEDDGEIKGYIGRNIKSKKEIDYINKCNPKNSILRYINSSTDFSKLSFGYDEIIKSITKTLICVEGIFDKWNVDKLMNLHEQEEVKCNGTFKCAISSEQIYKWQLKGVENLILFYDPDVINKIKRVANELQLYFNVLIAFNDEIDVDAGDITKDDLSRVFKKLYTVSEFCSNKVANKISF
jgi:hypothetical protein